MSPSLEEQVQLLITTRDADGEEDYYEKDFEDDEVILDEEPLAAVQDIENGDTVLACQNCFAVLGPSLEACLGRSVEALRDSYDGEEDEDEAGPSSSGAGASADAGFPVAKVVERELHLGMLELPGSSGIQFPFPPHDSKPNDMGWKFCSEECECLARSRYPDLLVWGDAGSEPTRSLAELCTFARETNPVVLLVARAVARTLAAANGLLRAEPPCEAWGALQEAWRPFALGQKALWWELPVAGQSRKMARQLQRDRREVCEVAAALIKRGLWDERFPALFDVRVVGALFGMVELNNLGLVVKSPAARWAESRREVDEDSGTGARTWDEHVRKAERQLLEFVEEFGDRLHVEGTGFYALQSCCNHSCEPNAYAFKDDADITGNAVIRAMRPIKAGEEITISYIDEDAPLKERQDALVEYGFMCECPNFAASAESELPSPPDATIEEVTFDKTLANSVAITGNLGTDVELKYFENSTKSATIPVAIGRRDKPATWVDVVVWNELAEKAQQSLSKGTKVQVEGYLNKHTNGRLHVVARTIRKVARYEQAGEAQAAPRQPRLTKDEIENLWMSFFEKPSDWRDYRADKANGTAKPRHPDFKMVEGGMSAPALWISTSPDWVKNELQKLDSQSNSTY